MSPDEVAHLLDAVADRIEAAIHNPRTHIPLTGEDVGRLVVKILREAAAEIG